MKHSAIGKNVNLRKLIYNTTNKVFWIYLVNISFMVRCLNKYANKDDKYHNFKISGCLLLATMSYNFIIEAISTYNCIKLEQFFLLYQFLFLLFLNEINECNHKEITIKCYIMTNIITCFSAFFMIFEFKKLFSLLHQNFIARMILDFNIERMIV